MTARLFQRIFEIVTGTLLAFITALTTLDVVGRYLFNRPLRGAFELTEMVMATLIFAALPLVTLRREHVAVDLLDAWLGPRARKVQHALIQVACTAILAVLAWVMFRQARQSALDGLHTDALRLPIAPILYFGAAAILVAAIIHFIHACRPPGPERPADEPPL
jgi:TRAP-type C4-dicarboxylate transport system permease small subunit